MHTELLERYAPILRYDLFEPDTLGNVNAIEGDLCRVDGRPIARFAPDYLGAKVYRDGELVLRGDTLVIHRRASGTGVIYGRALEQAGALWLGYWLWYGRNGFHWSLSGWHHGDWEYVSLRVPIEGHVPDVAVYAQHRAGEARPWGRVRQHDGRPLVFVALGSHASHFDRGPLATGARSPGILPLEAIDERSHPWLQWPGRWGQSVSGGRWSNSPRGPAFKRQWHDPGGWAHAVTGLPPL